MSRRITWLRAGVFVAGFIHQLWRLTSQALA
jgi:hypothetical protein